MIRVAARRQCPQDSSASRDYLLSNLSRFLKPAIADGVWSHRRELVMTLKRFHLSLPCAFWRGHLTKGGVLTFHVVVSGERPTEKHCRSFLANAENLNTCHCSISAGWVHRNKCYSVGSADNQPNASQYRLKDPAMRASQ